MRSALAYLGRYASSEENLRRILRRKVERAAASLGRDPAEFHDLIDITLQRCRRTGLVDDASYAQSRMASLRRRGRSSRQIEAQLAAKGVPRAVIEATLSGDEDSDMAAARRLARRRRLGPWRTRGQREDYRDRDMAALCRAGFSFEIARQIILGDCAQS